MKYRNVLLLLFMLFTVTLSTYSKDYFNNNYKIDKSNYSLAFIPIYNDSSPMMNDTLSTKIFNKKANILTLSDIADIRRSINSDEKMIAILTKISEKKYKGKELKTFPNLDTILTSEEIAYMKEVLNNADLFLFPIEFGVKNTGMYTFGSCKFRLYDLNTGELISECSKNVNVNVGGIDGRGGITAALLSLTFEYLDKKFISSIK